MNTRTTQHILFGLLMAFLFTACSRPVAYFQKSQRESFATKTTASVETPIVAVVADPATAMETPAVQPAPAQAALAQLDAVVSSDNKLAANKSVQKRMNRVKTLLAAATQPSAVNTAPSQPQKMNLVQRMMVKKMNKRINKQLAPEHPNKPMANTPILVTGAIAVIVGLVLLLIGSGTVGTIVLLAGAVVLLLGLLTGR